VPSFDTIKPKMDMSTMPLTGKAIADNAASARKAEPAYSGLGRTITPANQVSASRRQNVRIYRFNTGCSAAEVETIANAIYSQVLDIRNGEIPATFRNEELETKLAGGQISVREFVQALASSPTYSQRFCTPYPQTKVIEFLCRHLLGRTPATQAEINEYKQLLDNAGLASVVNAIASSQEYIQFFGENVVPYQRIPSLPAGNYLGSVKAD
jgi:phycobilisome core-membrane linker protein